MVGRGVTQFHSKTAKPEACSEVENKGNVETGGNISNFIAVSTLSIKYKKNSH